jgi:hypothetical protein
LKRHIDTVSLLFFIYGGLQLFLILSVMAMFFAFVVFAIIGGVTAGEPELIVIGAIYGFFGLVGTVVGLMFPSLNIATGVGLRRRRPWVKIVGIIASIFCIMRMPIGTALGVFGLVLLLDKEVGDELAGIDPKVIDV